MSRVFVALCIIAMLGMSLAGWVPYYNPPSVALDIVPLGDDSVCVVGGYSNTMMGVYCSIHNDHQSFERVPMQSPSFMFTAITVAPNNVAATCGMGFEFMNSSSIMYAQRLLQNDGFYPSNVSAHTASQDIKYVKARQNDPVWATRFAVAGDFDIFDTEKPRQQGLLFSYDGGATYNKTVAWESNLSQYTSIRYADYPDDNTFYATGGHWPSRREQELQDLVNNCLRVSRNICHPQPQLTKSQIFTANRRVYASNTLRYAMNGNNGYYGVITRTTDAGRTWQIVQETTGYYFNDISCSTPTNCVAVAEGDNTAMIYATQDGVNWEKVYEMTSLFMASLFRIRFATPTVAYASGGHVGDDRQLTGIILKSIDAGRTWSVDATEPGVGIFFGLNFNHDGTIGYTVGATNEQSSVLMRYDA